MVYFNKFQNKKYGYTIFVKKGGINLNQKLAAHEMMEVHELLAFKNVCATKAAAMSNMATDPELQQLLTDDVAMAKNHAQQLQKILRQTM